jgi:hypothetical protein
MAGISLTAVEQLPDALPDFRFLLEVQPSAAADQTIVQALMLRCQTVDWSGVIVETVPVALHGFEMQFRGRGSFSKTISATFVETFDGAALNALLNWKEAVVGTTSGNGGYRSAYSALGVLSILDVTGTVTHSQNIFYMWPQDVQNISLNGGSSGIVTITTTFSYDYVTKIQGVNYNSFGTAPTV